MSSATPSSGSRTAVLLWETTTRFPQFCLRLRFLWTAVKPTAPKHKCFTCVGVGRSEREA